MTEQSGKTYKTYIGARESGACKVVVATGLGSSSGYWLDPRIDLVDHSPTGFEWGYSGSGPAQLAVAILADATGDEDLALEHAQMFKACVIALLPYDGWQLPQERVLAWLEDAKDGSPGPFLTITEEDTLESKSSFDRANARARVVARVAIIYVVAFTFALAFAYWLAGIK